MLTKSFEEGRARLSATSVPLDTSSEGLYETLLAVVGPAERIELLGEQHCTADGETATLERWQIMSMSRSMRRLTRLTYGPRELARRYAQLLSRVRVVG